jgi:hypothetical protein
VQCWPVPLTPSLTSTAMDGDGPQQLHGTGWRGEPPQGQTEIELLKRRSHTSALPRLPWVWEGALDEQGQDVDRKAATAAAADDP